MLISKTQCFSDSAMQVPATLQTNNPKCPHLPSKIISFSQLSPLLPVTTLLGALESVTMCPPQSSGPKAAIFPEDHTLQTQPMAISHLNSLSLELINVSTLSLGLSPFKQLPLPFKMLKTMQVIFTKITASLPRELYYSTPAPN